MEEKKPHIVIRKLQKLMIGKKVIAYHPEKKDANLGDIVPILILSKRISRIQDFMHYTPTLGVF